MKTLEPAARPLASWRDILTALDRHSVTSAVVAWLYAVTGPLAILLAVSTKAGFGQDQVAAWIFGAYAIPGFLSILTSYLYRQPSGVAWSIPGAILIGPALDHLSFAEVIGANIVAGLLIGVLGITGWVRKVMRFCPLPVVMGMVCGVFLPFGLKIITGFEDNFWIALAIVVAFIVSSAVPAIGKRLPPVLAALAAGVAAVLIAKHGTPTARVHFGVTNPTILIPEFSLRALLELVLPLAVTVIGIHNPQGFAVLEASNYKAPINALTLTCGITACSSPSVLKAIRRLDTAPEIPTSLAELAALSGVSRFQLLRGFARDVGTTPHAYLVQRRVRLVRRLLAAGRSPVDAALLAGFADQSHMTRAFVRQFGITPGRYKAAIA